MTADLRLSDAVRCILQWILMWSYQNTCRNRTRYLFSKTQRILTEMVWYKQSLHCRYTYGITSQQQMETFCQFHYSRPLFCCSVQHVCIGYVQLGKGSVWGWWRYHWIGHCRVPINIKYQKRYLVPCLHRLDWQCITEVTERKKYVNIQYKLKLFKISILSL